MLNVESDNGKMDIMVTDLKCVMKCCQVRVPCRGFLGLGEALSVFAILINTIKTTRFFYIVKL